MADPPWPYRVWAGKPSRTADAHYDVMSIEDICGLNIQEVTADNCALFLWATPPAIKYAFQAMAAWGFEYKTFGFVWVKHNEGRLRTSDYQQQTSPVVWSTMDGEAYRISTGMGHYTRANAEPCLLGIRGRMPVSSKAVGQVILAPRRAHSEKPGEVYQKIEALYPGMKYLELFARDARLGWDAWGHEVESHPEVSTALSGENYAAQ